MFGNTITNTMEEIQRMMKGKLSRGVGRRLANSARHRRGRWGRGVVGPALVGRGGGGVSTPARGRSIEPKLTGKKDTVHKLSHSKKYFENIGENTNLKATKART